MVEQTRQLTIGEFVRRYEEAPFEIINGQHIPMSPTKYRHSKIAKRIYDAILRYTDVHKTGEVFAETVFVLEDQPDWVRGARVPDVMFIRRERLTAYEAEVEGDKPLVLVPDLVVEVISPTDRYSEVNAKIEAYVEDGVKIIWVVDPQRQSVAVYEEQHSPSIHRTDATLTGGAVAPGFTLTVSEVFS